MDLPRQADPIAETLRFWIQTTEGDAPVSARRLMTFVTKHAGWPRLGVLKAKIERGIADEGLRPHETADWFRRHPPESLKGLQAYTAALSALGQGEQARHAVTAFWTEAKLERGEAAAGAARYDRFLGPADHAARLDLLLWKDRLGEAEQMLPLVDSNARAVARVRIALARGQRNAPQMAAGLPPALQRDPGVLFARLRWHRRRDEDARALEILNAAPRPLPHAEVWWDEQNILARRALEEGRYARARDIAARHGLTDGPDLAQAEWLRAWIELRFLKQAESAYPRLAVLHDKVQSAVSKSRAAYWAARAAQALHKGEDAQSWHRVAARYPSTFYGQLSLRALGAAPGAQALAVPPPGPEATAAFARKDLVRALKLLDRQGLERYFDPFFAKLLSGATDVSDYQLIARLAADLGSPRHAVQANKDAQQKLGQFLLREGYPTLPATPADGPEKALVHAITYRESMFDPKVVSSAGARGLMQIMPATAKQVSQGRRAAYSKDRLTSDPRYNVLIGSTYLAQLIDRHDGVLPLAIASYNAGPGNVARWKSEFGVPGGRHDPVDWIELIPIYETRNYVQRVMETWYMYRLKFGQKPLTVLDTPRG